MESRRNMTVSDTSTHPDRTALPRRRLPRAPGKTSTAQEHVHANVSDVESAVPRVVRRELREAKLIRRGIAPIP